MIHTPYHFVPLSDWVYMPDWAHLVSHDVPFEDGYSGSIEYSLTNATPLCVGAEQQSADGKPTLVLWARDPKGNPVIPGSSIKGMLRSVLEIASFGKFQSVDNQHFSYRDISSANTTYAQELHETEVVAYWVKYDETRQIWQFRKSQWLPVFNDDLTKFTQQSFKNDPGVTVKQKYQKWPLASKAISFAPGNRTMMGTRGKEVTVACASSLGQGDLLGYPVFTGFRPGKKEVRDGRLGFNYLFHSVDEMAQVFEHGTTLVNRLFENHNEELVQYFKQHPHPELGIPVFARKTKKGELIALGFAKMPRKLYEKSVHDLVLARQKLAQSAHIFDMAELIFGTLREFGFSLKSRVAFSDAVCRQKTALSFSKPVILSQPKASFLAAYLEQETAGTLLTTYQSQAKLKGWKRYPVKPELDTEIPADLQNKVNVQSQLEMMAPKAEFSGKLVFHNLKKEELAALLWALQLPAESDLAYHSLGHGKPLGAGAVRFHQVQLQGRGTQNQPLPSVEELTALFAEHMSQAYPTDDHSWRQSPQLTHLLAMADLKDNAGKNLSYMALADYKNCRGLPDFKKQDQALSRKSPAMTTQPKAFAAGRLADLIKAAGGKSELAVSEKLLLQQRQEQEAQAQLANASEAGRLFMELKAKIEGSELQNDPMKQNPLFPELEKSMRLFIDEGGEEALAKELVLLVRDTARCNYLKLSTKKKENKQKLNERKALIVELAAKFGIA
ncbi:TIGR03986 family CRISPR-associated RAMP protein [Alkalimonas sp. MEB108]|uniref:TIGR03986 family CRISPR-associated RAMP protein n=1 Tax=Alkalimonas cellulosilytica TaxID=3058395 RepID=A0ABU7JAK6_9GAMM|nr:TIGR03986 family CRISPR-associated RAMP protein [Alkalimonas sp. MEB108]MEE2003022.1 TIGR03986 family CRISPR-associated RAMP protein [Alkalimonas sp. MEB108]